MSPSRFFNVCVKGGPVIEKLTRSLRNRAHSTKKLDAFPY